MNIEHPASGTVSPPWRKDKTIVTSTIRYDTRV